MPTRPSSRNAVLVALAVVVALGALAAFGAQRLGLVRAPWQRRASAASHTSPVSHGAGALPAACALAATWVNGTAPRASDLDGHPVLVVAWCDTHPDGLASLARAEEIRQAYERYGVRVIAIHEPDFSFSTDTAVVARAARRAGVHFPIALDPAGRMAARLGITELRASSLIADTSGALFAPRRGLAGIEANQLALRSVLDSVHHELRFPVESAVPAQADNDPARVRTIYLGVGRAVEGPITTAESGRAVPFTAQFRFEVEGKAFVPYPVGWWRPEADGLIAARGGAATFIALRYQGGALDAVISPPPGSHARVWILSDEHWLAADALGADAHLDPRGASYVDVDEPRLYRLTHAAGPHQIKLSPEAAGVTFHALLAETVP